MEINCLNITENQREILIEDLCMRLPYGVLVESLHGPVKLTPGNADFIDLFYGDDNMMHIPKPYLRSLSSMTSAEREEMGREIKKDAPDKYGEIKPYGEDNLLLCTCAKSTNFLRWLNARHFDYRGLIKIGLAIEIDDQNKISAG